MTDREKLIQLLIDSPGLDTFLGDYDTDADFLLANGVTFATDTNVGSKWIPVTERLPEESGDLYIVTAYNEEIWWNRVVVLTAEFYRGSWTWNENGREWDLTDSVTHWMPLPEPPVSEGA